MKAARLKLFGLILLAPLAACATAGRVASRNYLHSAYTSDAYPSARIYSSWSAAAAAMLGIGRKDAPPLSSDESVGATGVLGQTVNEVVPIPGTDMIRVGALQEGSFFQSSFRNPSQEAATRGGGVTGAVVIFRIFRP